jgi:hypothetical protein
MIPDRNASHLRVSVRDHETPPGLGASGIPAALACHEGARQQAKQRVNTRRAHTARE